MRLVRAGKGYVQNLNSENVTQNTSLSPSQILMFMEQEGHNVYFVRKFRLRTAVKPNKLKRHLEAMHAECVGKTPESVHRKTKLVSYATTKVCKDNNCYIKTRGAIDIVQTMLDESYAKELADSTVGRTI
jgi:hypothetical protein